jgi:hypothetical protein
MVRQELYTADVPMMHLYEIDRIDLDVARKKKGKCSGG